MAAPRPSVCSVYASVLDDVMIKVRGECLASGAGDDFIDELQGVTLFESRLDSIRSSWFRFGIDLVFGMFSCGGDQLWETKLRQSGEVSGLVPRPSARRSSVGVHDLNVPYAGSEVYQTPTADLLFPLVMLCGIVVWLSREDGVVKRLILGIFFVCRRLSRHQSKLHCRAMLISSCIICPLRRG